MYDMQEEYGGGWVDLGGDEGYFAEDRESVYCEHGYYVGYPGGADFMCHLCEDGRTYLGWVIAYPMFLHFGGEEHSWFTTYNFAEVAKNYAAFNGRLKPGTFSYKVVREPVWMTYEEHQAWLAEQNTTP